uniref:LisH domain-containing protein n=1 Tax=Timema monikensis TaxID=170555 RepID=A0A7R9HVT6_9NEOP|nr:unnamed protein product [Timema monikensis]
MTFRRRETGWCQRKGERLRRHGNRSHAVLAYSAAFNDRGYLGKLQTLLRQQMISALQDTPLGTRPEGRLWCAVSPKCYAINLLIAEFLLQQEYHYTLSVFTSEVPLLRNLPEFSVTLGSVADAVKVDSGEGLSHFQNRDVTDIMEALGFPADSDEVKALYSLYQYKREPLLTCFIRTISETSHRSKVSPSETMSAADKTRSSSSRDSGKQPAEESNSLLICRDDEFVKEVHKALLETNIKNKYSLFSKYVHSLHESRLFQACVELKDRHSKELSRRDEAHRHRLEELESRHRHETVEREACIQAQLTRHEEETSTKLSRAEQAVARQKEIMETELVARKQQLSEMAQRLKDQQSEVSCRLHMLEVRCAIFELDLASGPNDYRGEVRQQEQRFQESSQHELSQLAEKQQLVEQELSRERQATLREGALQAAKTLGSHEDAECLNKEEGEKPKQAERNSMASVQHELEESYNRVQHMSQSLSQSHELQEQCNLLQQELDATRHKLRNVSDSHRSQQTEPMDNDNALMTSVVEQLRQENTELRAHVQQLRRRIDELTVHAAQLSAQLQEALAARHSPPLPPPLPSRRDSTVGDGSRSAPVRGRGVPTRLIIHTGSSSEENSPTDEILREAHARLRRLEEESDAVDRSYRNFRLRQSDSLFLSVPYRSASRCRHLLRQSTFPRRVQAETSVYSERPAVSMDLPCRARVSLGGAGFPPLASAPISTPSRMRVSFAPTSGRPISLSNHYSRAVMGMLSSPIHSSNMHLTSYRRLNIPDVTAATHQPTNTSVSYVDSLQTTTIYKTPILSDSLDNSVHELQRESGGSESQTVVSQKKNDSNTINMAQVGNTSEASYPLLSSLRNEYSERVIDGKTGPDIRVQIGFDKDSGTNPNNDHLQPLTTAVISTDVSNVKLHQDNVDTTNLQNKSVLMEEKHESGHQVLEQNSSPQVEIELATIYSPRKEMGGSSSESHFGDMGATENQSVQLITTAQEVLKSAQSLEPEDNDLPVLTERFVQEDQPEKKVPKIFPTIPRQVPKPHVLASSTSSAESSHQQMGQSITSDETNKVNKHDVSLSSMELSSDQPISVGRDSKDADVEDDDFW